MSTPRRRRTADETSLHLDQGDQSESERDEREPSPLATSCQVKKKFGKNTHLRRYGLSIDPGREIEIVSLLSISPPTWVSPQLLVPSPSITRRGRN